MLIHNFFSFIIQSYSFKSRQVGRQILSAMIILMLPYFEKEEFKKTGNFTEFWFAGLRN